MALLCVSVSGAGHAPTEPDNEYRLQQCAFSRPINALMKLKLSVDEYYQI